MFFGCGNISGLQDSHLYTISDFGIYVCMYSTCPFELHTGNWIVIVIFLLLVVWNVFIKCTIKWMEMLLAKLGVCEEDGGPMLDAHGWHI